LARGLTQAQIDQGVGDHRTALPAHLNAPKGWLKDSRPAPEAAQTGEAGATGKDPHAIVGVDPGASMKDIRAAWLRQIKDLDPDRSAGEPPVSERIKTINQAYQELKDSERHAKEEHTRGAFRRGPNIAFAAALVVVIAVSALIATLETYLDHPVVVAPGGATPAVHSRVQAAPSG
jgi:hypothetical protein